MARHRSAEDRPATSFIGSFLDGPDQVVIELRGDLDTEVMDRLDVHVEDVLVAGTRFLTIDAAGVTTCDAGLLDLLGRAQRRLSRVHGLLTVRGLRPHLLLGAPAVAGPPPSDGTLSDARQATS